MKLDLHIHSTASDGTCSPQDVVARAVEGGLDVIALADHDTTAGIREASTAAKGKRLQVIPATELSSTEDGAEIHILGYFVNPGAPALAEYGVRSRERREARMNEMLSRLALQGVPLLREAVDRQRSSSDVAPARPHLARALVDAGYAVSVPDAFARLIGDGSPAYVATDVASPADAIAAIVSAGGIPVWAHPPQEVMVRFLPALVEAGLRGIEVYRPRAKNAWVVTLEQEARRHGLVTTGGSDWHGPDGGRALGDFYVSGDEVAGLLAAGGM